MRGVRVVLFGGAIAVTLAASMPSSYAVHFYRGTGGGCSPTDGPTTDDPEGTTPNVKATVIVGHNTFSEGIEGFSAITPVETRIKSGESIRWTWNSSHCHSVTSSTMAGASPLFDSGFHYPTAPPESQQVAPGAFDYPMLDDTPTLSYVRTFPTPGTYEYFCVHHTSIGMKGVIVVE